VLKGNFGFCYEPGSEAEVQVLFGALMPYMGELLEEQGLGSDCYVDEFTGTFPDCILQVGGRRVAVEFELYSSHFRDHGHDSEKCDVILCWKHDWYSCPQRLKILELHKLVSLVENRYGIKIILQKRQKYPDRGGMRWSVDEFMGKLKQNLPNEDYTQLKNFIDELIGMRDKGVELQTGRGRKVPTLGIGFGKLSDMEYPIAIEATGKAWIAYKNVNVSPPKQIINKEKAEEIRRFLKGTSEAWHYIRAGNTTDLIDKLKKVINTILS
jgi:hypothetical protein